MNQRSGKRKRERVRAALKKKRSISGNGKFITKNIAFKIQCDLQGTKKGFSLVSNCCIVSHILHVYV